MFIEYDENGYLIFEKLLECRQPFIFLTGGRGTGKTYGAAQYVITNGVRFLWMRRTQTETDLINKPEFHPFKPINTDLGYSIAPEKVSKGSAAFYDADDPEHEPLGYTCALSTISSMRGFDASDVKIMIYDEFIPERHKAAMRSESDALFNAYETVNRNRELKGEDPVQLVAMANSNRLDNEIFLALGITDICERMKKEGSAEYVDASRGMAVFMLDASPIADKKSKTALYKLTRGSSYAEMALDNTFTDLSEHVSTRRNLREYIPVATVGALAVYRKKSGGLWYVTRTRSGVFKKEFGDTDKEKLAFIRAYPLLWEAYLRRKIEFSDYTSEALFRRLY